jgi:sulfur carrier protein
LLAPPLQSEAGFVPKSANTRSSRPEPSVAGKILPMKITIELNGEPYSVEAGTVVVSLLEELKLKPKRVAVEINQTVVPKADYECTALREGDHVEVINFVGGG